MKENLSKFLVQVLVQVQVPPENSRTLIFSSSGCLVIKKSSISLRAGAPRFQAGPDSRQAPIPGRPRFQLQGGNPNLDKNLDKELGQILSRVFLLQSHLSKFRPGNLDKELGQLRAPCKALTRLLTRLLQSSLQGSSQGSLQSSMQGSLQSSLQGSLQSSLQGSLQSSLQSSLQGFLQGSKALEAL